MENRMSGIHDAIRQDDLALVEKILLEDPRQVNFVVGDLKNTPLHVAASQGNLKAAKILLEHGADIRMFNKRGALPIHLATTYNHKNMIELLLAYDSSLLNMRDKNNNTSLHIAVWKRRPEIVQFLLQLHARIDLKNKDGNLVYHVAVLWNRPFILKTLLKYSSSLINELNYKGFSALHLAAMNNLEACVLRLLLHNASHRIRDKTGKSPDDYGNEYTQKTFLKFKLYRGIKASCMTGMAPILAMRKYFDNSTTLHIVASFADSNVLIQQLITYGSDVNAVDVYGKTPLCYAIQSGCLGNIKTLMLSGGDSSYLHMMNEKTPLHMAMETDDLKLAEFLLKQNTNVNSVDKSGDTPLIYAIVNHFRTGVQLLLEYGAVVTNVDTHGNTPLHLSVTANNFEITNDILNVTTDNVNSYNSYGHTPLMCAILGRNTKLTKLLLENGADLNFSDNNGKSAFSLALNTNLNRLIDVVVTHKKMLQEDKENPEH